MRNTYDREYIYTHIYTYICEESTIQLASMGFAHARPNKMTNGAKFSLCIHRANSEWTAYWTSSSLWQVVQHWTTIRHSTSHIDLLPAILHKTHELNAWSADVLVRDSCRSTSLLENYCHCFEVVFSKWELPCWQAGVKVLCTSAAYMREESSSHTKSEEGEGIVIYIILQLRV